MKTLIYVVGLALFSFFTDFSSSSGFEGIFSPILSGLLLILLVGKVTSSFGGSGNYTAERMVMAEAFSAIQEGMVAAMVEMAEVVNASNHICYQPRNSCIAFY